MQAKIFQGQKSFQKKAHFDFHDPECRSKKFTRANLHKVFVISHLLQFKLFSFDEFFGEFSYNCYIFSYLLKLKTKWLMKVVFWIEFWWRKKSSNYLTRGQERSCEASYSRAGRGGHGYATAFLTTATLALGTAWHDWGLQTSIGTCDLSGWHWAATCLALGTGTFGSCHHYGFSIMSNGCKIFLSSLFFTKPTFDSIINFCFFDLTVDDFKLIAELWVGRPADAENWEQAGVFCLLCSLCWKRKNQFFL